MTDNGNNKLTFSPGWSLIYCAIAITTLSQIETTARFLRPAMYSMWGLVIILGFVSRSRNVRLSPFTVRFISSFILFAAFCMITAYGKQNYLRVLGAPLLMTIVSDLYVDRDGRRSKNAIKVYIFSALIYAIWVNLTYFRSYSSWLAQRSYVFQQKNSAGQIWCVAAILLLFFVDYVSKEQRIIGVLLAIYFFIISSICQCRTASFAIAITIVSYAISKAKHKFRWIVLIAVGVVVLWNIPFTRAFFDKALLITRYQGADLDTFSSGRIGYWKLALETFLQHPIIGVGQYYVDCSYLSILAETGIIGFLLIENIWFKKIQQCLSFREEKKETTLLFCLTIFYIVESVLEGYPPFGPGVSAFMFWFLSGLIIGKRCSR